MYELCQKRDGATIWAINSQTHLVTLYTVIVTNLYSTK
jgi:hypothetical protein